MTRSKAVGAGRIACCLIVQDEEERLPGCLRAVAFCDEVVVVDGGSRDRTVEIARAAGARVVENPWPGFAAQRNVALDATSAEWVLEIDADEHVTPQLAASIRAHVDDPGSADMAVCPRRNRFLGAMLGPAGQYPEYCARLFRREAYRHDESLPVHEGLFSRGPTAVLDGDLEHDLAATWTEATRDAWRYARLQASYMASPRSPWAYFVGIFARPAAKFVYRAGFEGGWRDGWRGFAKIALDCLSDALTWTLLLLALFGRDRRRASGTPARHFGRAWGKRSGAVKVVAAAAGASATERAVRWLADASAAGACVALITDQPEYVLVGALALLQPRVVPRLSPVNLLRAVTAESQLQPIDALMVFQWKGQIARSFVPRHLKGPRIMNPGMSADDVVARASERLSA